MIKSSVSKKKKNPIKKLTTEQQILKNMELIKKIYD
jgi:hypothetical protein